VTIHRLLRDFSEGPTDPGGNEGGGAPPSPGDATWEHAVHDSVPWTTAGGDFDPTPSASGVIAETVEPVFVEGAGLGDDIERWRTGTLNAGWLMAGDETRTQSVKRFESRQSPVPEDRPTLVVQLIGPP
jgi:hypothetical protein